MCCIRKLQLIQILLFLLSYCSPSLINNGQFYENQLSRSKRNESEEGVIVQPSWTQKETELSKTNKAVKVTKENLDEVKALRDQINRAINQDHYLENITSTSAFDAENVRRIDKELSLKSRSKEALNLITGAAQTNRSEENVGSSNDKSDSNSTDFVPNIIEANNAIESDIDISKLQSLEVSRRRTKEVLILKSIEEDYSFTLGEDVTEWSHIMHNGSEFFVGRREMDLLIVKKDSSNYKLDGVLNIGAPIISLTTYSFWNSQQEQQEGVILVTFGDRLQWYRVNETNKQIELYWEWSIGSAVSELKYFHADSNAFLVLCFAESAGYALNIYQFELEGKQFWITQRMQMTHPCRGLTVMDTGRDLILAIVQNSTAVIYAFNPHIDGFSHIRFQHLHSFESTGIEYISSFKMGGRSYLALGGDQPQILLYQQGDLIPITILAQNFGRVELFFPIPVQTYRDDLLLLVQHRIDFGTHYLTVLETLIWDGKSFEVSIPVPCHLGAHTLYGASCMLDIQRDEGLKGAALIKRGDEISILIPRYKVESGLYRLHTELLKKNSELLDLKNIFDFLKEWVKEQDQLIAQAEEFLALSDNELTQINVDLFELDTLKTPELIFSGDVGEIHINNCLWTNDDTNANLNTLIQAIDELEQEFQNGNQRQRQRRDLRTEKLVFNKMHLDTLNVEYLTVEQQNNERFYIQNGSIDFPGVLALENLQVQDEYVTRDRREVIENVVHLNGDLNFMEINGIPWVDIEENLVFRNKYIELASLNVEGEVIIEDDLTIDVLNNLNFPNDYLLSSGPQTSRVTGEKFFSKTLAANAIDSDGIINGINPFDVISLSEPQIWKGLPTFTHLEVAEQFELKGKAQGRDLENFPTNPTLLESKFILAACNFENLYVNGPVLVTESFDTLSMVELIADIEQIPEDAAEPIFIAGSKTFSTIELPIDFKIGDDKVNDINIEQFVTIHTTQSLNITKIEGFAYFHNLNISGLYDEVDLFDLMNRSIKITEIQNAENTQLNFVNVLASEKLKVVQTLNGQSIDDGYQTIKSDIDIFEAHFHDLKTKVLHIPNNIDGTARINGIHLGDFFDAHSWKLTASVRNIYLNELVLQDDLQVDSIHGINTKYIFDFLESVDTLPAMIFNGTIQVDYVTVLGNVHVNKLNGQRFNEDILQTSVWLNRRNYLSSTLNFKAPLILNSTLTVLGDYNYRNLPNFIEDIVFRTTNKTIVIEAPKLFSGNIYVSSNTQLNAINGVQFGSIGTTVNVNNFSGSVEIHGRLDVHDLTLENLNGYPLSKLHQLICYDEHFQKFILRGTTSFVNELRLKDLTVMGKVQHIPNLNSFFNDLVYRNSLSLLNGKKTFTGRVSINGGMHIAHLNELNLLDLYDNIVFIGESESAVINTPVIFKNAVHANDVFIKHTLRTKQIAGCSLNDWLDDTLRVDYNEAVTEKLYFAATSLDGNFVNVDTVNGINAADMIVLNYPQNLSTNHLQFSTIYLDGNITTGGFINSVDLQLEFENTLMIYGNQHVSTPLTLAAVNVFGNLYTNALVNGDKNLSEVATLLDDLHIHSPIFFQNVIVSNLQTDDLVSGINLTDWHDKSLKMRNKPQQTITGNWSIREIHIKSKGISVPSDTLNDVRPWNLRRTSNTRSAESDENLNSVYQNVSSMLHQLKFPSYFIKHVERKRNWSIGSDFNIRKVFVLHNKTTVYLIMNVDCMSMFYEWHFGEETFTKKSYFESGLIDQAILIPPRTNTQSVDFLTLSLKSTVDYNCSLQGLNSWHITSGERKVIHLRNYERRSYSAAMPQMNKLYGIVDKCVQEISLQSEIKIKTIGKLPHEDDEEGKENASSYHFIPQPKEYNTYVLLTNGYHILMSPVVNNSHAIVHMPRGSEETHAAASTSRHHNNFDAVLESLLTDLLNRLHLAINSRELSTPATNLYDENQMHKDFAVFIEKLQTQQILRSKSFPNVNWSKWQITQTPLQMLATRVILDVWSIAEQMQAIHSDSNHEQLLCSCLTSTFHLFLNDILLLITNNTNNTENINSSNEMTAVIQRIQEFQSDLQEMIEQLNANIVNDKLQISSSKNFTNERGERMLGLWNILQRNHLPPFGKGEMLSMSVGSDKQTHSLLAVANSRIHIAGSNDSIKLFMGQGLNDTTYQTIMARRPHLLHSLRIHDHTFLLYVENCCDVNIVVYKGVEGFVQFTQFQLKEDIRDIISFSLPSGQNAKEKHMLAIVCEKKIEFYEFVVTGNGHHIRNIIKNYNLK